MLTPDGRLLAVLDVDSGACLCTRTHTLVVLGLAAVPPADLSALPHALVPACIPTCSLLASPSHPPRPAALPHADLPAAFTDVDAQWLERLCADLGARPWSSGL